MTLEELKGYFDSEQQKKDKKERARKVENLEEPMNNFELASLYTYPIQDEVSE